MWMKIAGAAVLALCTAAPVAAAEKVIEARYTCERGVEIPVVYINGDVDVAVLWVEGRLVSLPRMKSGSGARYGTGPKSGYVWWDKGDTAMLDWFDAEIGEEVTLFAFCKTSE